MESLLQFLAAFVLVCLVCNWLGFTGRDETDNKSERSGLILYTDHGTGVQYVGTILGGITPRLDANGNVVVKK